MDWFVAINLFASLFAILFNNKLWVVMEASSLIIFLGTSFVLLILAAAGIIIITTHNKRKKLEVELLNLELQKQKEISENTLKSQEDERQHVGLELHDELGPTFAAIRINVERIKQRATKLKCAGVVDLAVITTGELEVAINQFSDLSKMLYPVILMRQGLQAALTDLVDKANQSERIDFHMTNSVGQPPKQLLAISIYRICQELLTNALKHSNAKHSVINITSANGSIVMHYKDDGVGFDQSVNYMGLGLNSIKGRVEALDGEMDIKSSQNQGVEYNFSFPL
jgi:signal transduction histidine kinase